MKTQTTKSKATYATSMPYDLEAMTTGFSAFSEFQGKFASIALEAASMSTDICASSTKKALVNLRRLSEVRERSEYGQALSEFTQAQAKLLQDTAASLAEVMRGCGTAMGELTTETTDALPDKASKAAKAPNSESGDAKPTHAVSTPV